MRIEKTRETVAQRVMRYDRIMRWARRRYKVDHSTHPQRDKLARIERGMWYRYL